MTGMSIKKAKIRLLQVSIIVPIITVSILYIFCAYLKPCDSIGLNDETIYIVTAFLLLLSFLSFPLLKYTKNKILSRSYRALYPSSIEVNIMLIGIIPFISSGLGMLCGTIGIVNGMGNRAILCSIPFFSLTIAQTRLQVWDKLDEICQVEDSISEVGLNRGPLNGRTSIDIEKNDETIWNKLDKWADSKKFLKLESTESSRLYKRDCNIFICPLMIKIYDTGDNLRIESWITLSFRNPYTLAKPSEIKIESGHGILLLGQRRAARKLINELLYELEVPDIEQIR